MSLDDSRAVYGDPGDDGSSSDAAIKKPRRRHGGGDLGAAVDVQPLGRLRPVPSPTKLPVAQRTAPPPPLPVYDPFSARRRPRPEWLVSYVCGLAVTDLLAGTAGLFAARLVGASDGAQTAIAAGTFLVAWPLLLTLLGAYAERRLGSGSDEYRRVLVAGMAVSCLIQLAGLVPGVAPGRTAVVGMVVATAATLLGRLVNRYRLLAARRAGRMTKRVVLVGRDAAAADLARRIRRDLPAGLRVVGACVPRPGHSLVLADEGVPVLGDLNDVARVLDETRADAVLVASTSETAGQYLRELTWRLEGSNVEVLASPGLIEVAPSRLQVRPITTLPLIQVQEPEFRGVRRVVKSLLDRALAAFLLLLCAPVLLAVAVAVRLTSSGPALYRHRRIGKHGQEFDLFKFRSMVTGAEAQLTALLDFNEGNDVQFKMRRDPRVTRVGQVLRRYSLDELPQLINVLAGQMSLVGPRPHVAREVAQYGTDMQRRLLVKPGITGLWQISGRSNLSWDESVELDVRYVENWSLALDLSILWRTARAVLRSHGAY